MTKQSIMLQLLTQIKREFNIGEPRFPHLKLKVSDISPKQDAIELYIRAKDILWNSNLRERVCQDDFCKFSKFKYLSAEKSPNISCLHIS